MTPTTRVGASASTAREPLTSVAPKSEARPVGDLDRQKLLALFLVFIMISSMAAYATLLF